jgi:DNA-binding PadR family transcriptional regulator
MKSIRAFFMRLFGLFGSNASERSLSAEWGVSDNNRKAKFYTLTRTGRTRLTKDLGEWTRLVEAMTAVLGATRAEVSA